MGLRQAAVVLAESWPQIRSDFNQSDASRLVEQIRLYVAAVDAADEESVRRHGFIVADLLTELLPARHPVRRALAVEDTRLAGPGFDPAQVAALLRDLLPPGGESPAGTTAEQIAEEARSWLSSAPALGEDQVRQAGHDPRAAGLIRFAEAGRLPAFQFDASIRPIPVVLQINGLLDAAADPWGVADWWLGENAWLGVAPVELLGRGEDRLLVAAAEAVAGED